MADLNKVIGDVTNSGVTLSFPSTPATVGATSKPIAYISRPSPESVRAAIRRVRLASGRRGFSMFDLSDPFLFPDGDTYPFIEWSDLTASERSYVGWVWGTSAMKGLGFDPGQQGFSKATFGPKFGAAPDAETAVELIAEVVSASLAVMATTVATMQTAAEKQSAPTPARPGHLMAEGSMLLRVKETVGNRTYYGRKVSFPEPVNAYTCLYGDRIAHGGDMITAVTTKDTTIEQSRMSDGSIRTTYVTEAVAL